MLGIVIVVLVAGLIGFGLFVFHALSDDSPQDLGPAHDLVSQNLPAGMPLSNVLMFLHSAQFSTFAEQHSYFKDPNVCTDDYTNGGCTYGNNQDQALVAARKKCPQCTVVNATLDSPSTGKLLIFWLVFDRSNHRSTVSLDGYSPSL